MVGQVVLDDVECARMPNTTSRSRCGSRRQQIAHHVGAHDLLVNGVGLDVLAVEPRQARVRPSARSASSSLRDPGEEVISVAAKWPTAAPRWPRCNPNSDIRLTTASASAGTASMYAR